MQMRRLIITMFCLLPTAALMYGCGSSSKSGGTLSSVAKVDETACAQCHAQAVDKIDPSATIYAKYNASLHFTNNFNTVGCQDCHGGGAQHNGVGPLPYPNPDAAGQCFSCHKNYLNSQHYAVYPANATSTRDDKTTAKHNAQYVTTDYQNSCTSCHDSHQPKVGDEHKDWAESGHGDVAGLGWANYDFKFGADCSACHTSTGFISYVSSGYTVPTTTFAKAGDSTHEVLTCKACHTDYNFKNRIRNTSAVKAMYTYAGQAITFPGVGASNLCVACHSGRGNVETARTTRYQGHHAPAAGILFNDKSHMGYEFAGKSYANATGFIHDNIGTSAAPGTGTNGPCVACHMDAATNTSSHKFAAVTKNSAGTITAVPTSAVCAKCHADVDSLDTMRLGYNEAGQLLKAYLDNTVANYLSVKVEATKKDAVTGEYVFVSNVYGASQNYLMVGDEAGAYVHNSAYAKRLIFDSIDWMDNGALTGSITIPVGYPNARIWFDADLTTGVASRP